MNNVRVLSAMMGSGKTTRLMQEVADLPLDARVLYLTPLLSECHRVAGTYAVEDDERQRPIYGEDGEYVYKPDHLLTSRRFRHPVLSKDGSKMDTLLVQIASGCNIVGTHALFRSITKTVIEEVRAQGYILILDEVLSVYEEFDDLPIAEANALIANKHLYIDVDGITIRFNRSTFGNTENTRYKDIADLCDVGQLCILDGRVVIWEFPVEALKAFKEVHIATYLFEGSPMCSYLYTNDFNVEVEHFGNSPVDIAGLITIEMEKKFNSVGDSRGSLSVSDLCGRKTSVEPLRKTLRNFFKTKHKVPLDKRLWTTYKSVKGDISGGLFAQSWLYCGAKATNDWQHASHVAYLVNIFLQPMLVKLMAKKGFAIDQDLYAVSEMVQFIWRSRIRNGEPITIYVPSARMRALLINWLNGHYDAKLPSPI